MSSALGSCPTPQRRRLFAGGLHTSAWIPLLLGAYYASAGGLLIAADSLLDGDSRSQNGARLQAPPGDSGSLASVALAFGCASDICHWYQAGTCLLSICGSTDTSA